MCVFKKIFGLKIPKIHKNYYYFQIWKQQAVSKMASVAFLAAFFSFLPSESGALIFGSGSFRDCLALGECNKNCAALNPRFRQKPPVWTVADSLCDSLWWFGYSIMLQHSLHVMISNKFHFETEAFAIWFKRFDSSQRHLCAESESGGFRACILSANHTVSSKFVEQNLF